MTKIAADGFTVKSPDNKWSLVWEDIGEGYSGDYDDRDPRDAPLFRASLLDGDGEFVDSGSYCTLAVVGKTTEDDLQRMSEELLNNIGEDFSRHVMEKWTWRTKV